MCGAGMCGYKSRQGATEASTLHTLHQWSCSNSPKLPPPLLLSLAGQPKGVVVEHRSWLNMAMNATANYGLTGDDVALLQVSISFDPHTLNVHLVGQGG